MAEIASYIYTFMTLLVVIFHVLVILGKPWGKATMGGKYPGVVPPKVRVGNFISAMLLVFFNFIILIKAHLILPEYSSFANFTIWIVLAFTILGSVLNTITPSKIERKIWAPFSYVMLVQVLIIIVY